MGDHPYVTEFWRHVREQQQPGLTCEGASTHFIPYHVLRSYWTLEKIRRLSRQNGITTNPEIIRKRYLVVFSIIVAVSQTWKHSLYRFDIFVTHNHNDSLLPFAPRPDKLAEEFQDQDANILEEFHNKQWLFCPVLMDPSEPLSNRSLDRRQIFPFQDVNETGDKRVNREATVSIVQLHARAHEHLDAAKSVPTRIVLKTYSHAYQVQYDKERQVYATLNTRTPNIVRCLGSFHWLSSGKERTNTLILEYAEGGTLLDFFNKSICPYEPSDVIALWRGLTELLKGLEVIHGQDGLRGIHQDLKPSNILLFPQHNFSGEFSYLFKITDFGACHVPIGNLSRQAHDAIYSRATRTYSAPELQHNENIRFNVDHGIDMWSIGCILVEAAVWITIGEQGRQRFMIERKKETSELPDHKALGKTDCFHDGEEVLQSVRDIKQRVHRFARTGDSISPQVVELVLDEVLVNKSARLHADQLYSRLSRIVHQCQKAYRAEGSPPALNRHSMSSESMPSPPKDRPLSTTFTEPGVSVTTLQEITVSPDLISSPTSPPPRRRQVSGPGLITQAGLRKGSFPHVSIDELSRWRHEKTSRLHGWEQASKQLKDRDFIFIIDNSASMQQHATDVIRFASYLAYLVKQLDPDGLEVLMTSDPQRKVKFTTSTDVQGFVRSQLSRGSEYCNMEHALGQALKDVQKRLPQLSPSSRRLPFVDRMLHGRSNPFSILVFTDGVWDPTEAGVCGADGPIESCIQTMKNLRVDRTDVAIQFLRFGNDEKGIHRLTVLDDELKMRPHNAGFDIVDHKYRDDSIWDILIGSVSAYIDGPGLSVHANSAHPESRTSFTNGTSTNSTLRG